MMEDNCNYMNAQIVQWIEIINQHYGLYITENSTHLETDTIYIEPIFTTDTIVLIDDIDSRSRSYVESYDTMNLVLIIIVGGLATTLIITACALLGLNCIKIHLQFKDEQYDINRRNIELNICDNNISFASPVPTMSHISSIIHEQLNGPGTNQQRHKKVVCIERERLRSLYN